MAEAKRRRGRPSKYSKAVGWELCRFLAEGDTVEAAALKVGTTATSVFRWLLEYEEFRESYSVAKEVAVERLVDEMVTISDTPLVGETVTVDKDGRKVVTADMLGHRRLQVDTRKWAACKLAPKKYGDRQKIEHTADDSLFDKIRAARKRALGEE